MRHLFLLLITALLISNCASAQCGPPVKPDSATIAQTKWHNNHKAICHPGQWKYEYVNDNPVRVWMYGYWTYYISLYDSLDNMKYSK